MTSVLAAHKNNVHQGPFTPFKMTIMCLTRIRILAHIVPNLDLVLQLASSANFYQWQCELYEPDSFSVHKSFLFALYV